MTVIAEGVETIEQLNQLQIKQCQYAHGYFFSPRLDSFSLEQLISSSLHPNPMALIKAQMYYLQGFHLFGKM